MCINSRANMCITGLKCFCLSERAPLLLCMPVSNADCRGACCLQSSVIMPVPPHGSVWCAVLYGAWQGIESVLTCGNLYCNVWYGVVGYGMVWCCASSSLLNHLQLFCLLPVISIEPPANSLEGNKVKTKNSYISFQ